VQTPPPNKTRRWLFGLGTVAVAVLFLPSSIQYFVDRHHYKQGLQAYNAANCTAAIAALDRVITANPGNDDDDLVATAKVKKAECQTFQKGVSEQQAGKGAAALLAYLQLAKQYPETGLMSATQQQTAQLFQQPSMVALVTPKVCDQAGTLTKHNLLPQPATNLPSFYQACGNAYADRKIFPQALAMFEKFLDDYPKHPQTAAVKRSYTQAIVNDTRAKGAGKIDRPGFSGSRGDGTTAVVIRNDSPEKMRIVFSGPTPRLEELAPCTDCKKYVGEGPKGCPNQGPVGTYVLEPGQYDVVVKSVSDRGVRPFTGVWGLDSGSEYNSCFFVVQKPEAAPAQ
jgi:tetratricopeptide (TPR) repeat protein